MDELTIYAEVRTNDGLTAKIVDPDTKWADDVPHVAWVAHEYPFKFILAFPDMTLDGLDYAAQYPPFKRNVEIALGKALEIFIANDFEV